MYNQTLPFSLIFGHFSVNYDYCSMIYLSRNGFWLKGLEYLIGFNFVRFGPIGLISGLAAKYMSDSV